ncbi:MAG: PRC-barrel domain containing protein [Caulobacteraceae bacterium]|nr:PRC-barrel domain containing protein [Caulobacteraceae bacterium]
MQTEHSAQGGASDRVVHRRLISADRVQGSTVYDQAGEKLGHIEDVMLDKASGRVAYAIMSYGGFLGAGERYHPLPWSMLSYDPGKNGYVVPLNKHQLADAPTLGRDQINEQDDTEWAEQVHTHYGLPGPFI